MSRFWMRSSWGRRIAVPGGGANTAADRPDRGGYPAPDGYWISKARREGAALTGNGAAIPERSTSGRPAGVAAYRGSSEPRKEVLKNKHAPLKGDILRAKEEIKT